ncbi:hypothetical protein UCRPA7_8296 [Phaeoacremonium minimum UCRPA7]|uniref:Uncharacterized protein n=1 Tax=Phaeoacremonium minimum (strain UCR-PA7) TaxID=1286976 RepID=R8BA62_PHAM7|nr:hypothetical protein UCRPA7_8296 [Phaeoacremonium minimum UCRPA7]EON96205.1 hypothetical protein UCRPA7_8296 [Phaeoacremonium minimum UCRPA7]
MPVSQKAPGKARRTRPTGLFGLPPGLTGRGDKAGMRPGRWHSGDQVPLQDEALRVGHGKDIDNAKAALENILQCQLTDNYDSAWYGTWKLSPDEPYPTDDSPLYPPEIYDTYDPNWREFVGTQLVQLVEEFSDLLGNDLVSRIEDALEIAAVGSMRRNGTFPEDDNLTIAYSNPALMRAWYVGWIGARRNNQTFIDFANTQGDLILKLFKSTGSNVLSEYNAPNYYGMDVWALAGNIKYGAKNNSMTTNAQYILTEVWKDVAAHYNSFLGNLAGPYDRAYTRDMTTHSAILSLFWWGMYGHEYGPQPPKMELDLVYDIAQGAALSLLMNTTSSYISADTAAALKAKGAWQGERFIQKKIPDGLSSDEDVRVATSWISSPLMIGAQQVAETKNRGQQFVPAIVQWAGDASHTPYPYVTFFSLYPTASTVDAVAGPRNLTISYPNTTQDGTDIFTFALSDVPPSWTLGKAHTIDGFEELPCLNVTLSAPGLEKQPVVYGSSVEDHRFYNISYVVPEGFEGVPKVSFEFDYIC